MLPLAQLVAQLEALEDRMVLGVIAAYPAHGETGHLEEQGSAMECLFTHLSAGVRSAMVFRVLWSTMAVTVPGSDADGLVDKIRLALGHCSSPSLELRAIVVVLDPDDATTTLDQCFGELSSRRNFGQEDLPFARRLCGTNEWSS